ncbi:hypothetical protein FHS16_004556 [Paenibacillus endophyticus]|uniref:Uncharacterized protein n=1 Tax=Paenibacillus endophyticus TaxID=1294268 RepID=A0A7W5CCT9_9BACL|nr:epimerase [Paenibacillus endophyticus]MBB3154474.1 hypothetical protein [Paenibacillus endophyticus]
MSREQMDFLGQVLMSGVRDQSISFWDKLIEGKMRGSMSKKISESYSTEQLEILTDIISQVVDTTLHNLLWTIEQEDQIHLKVQLDEDAIDIKEASDGLAGELYTEDGWIIKYSEKRYIEP